MAILSFKEIFNFSNSLSSIGFSGATGGVIGATGGVIGATGGVIGATGGVIGATGGVIGATGGVIGATGGVIGATGGVIGAQHIFNILFNNSSLITQFRSAITGHHKSVFEISFKTKSVLGPSIQSTGRESIYCLAKISSTNLSKPFIFIVSTHFIASICKAAIHSAQPVFNL